MIGCSRAHKLTSVNFLLLLPKSIINIASLLNFDISMTLTAAISSDPQSHYYAVIFTSTLTGKDLIGYSQVGTRMDELAQMQEGCLGLESSRNSQGLGITISYWKSLEAIQEWKMQAEHVVARELGRSVWYQSYRVRIAKVEREYAFEQTNE